MDMVYMSKIQKPNQNEKCQLKATHASSMKNEETLTAQGRLQLASNNIFHRYSEIVACIYSSNIKVN